MLIFFLIFYSFAKKKLVFRPPPFDILATLTYASVFTLDGLIVFLYYFLNWYHARKEFGIQNRNEEGTMVELGIKEESK